jgi:hypothetical protein
MLGRLLNTVLSPFAKYKHPLPRKHPNKPLPLPFANWKIFKGDTVMMRTGDDKGKVGRVVKVFRKLNRIVVRNANMNWKTKRTYRTT